ncbi:glycosyltransferase family 2 protein, partial [bacterium]
MPSGRRSNASPRCTGPRTPRPPRRGGNLPAVGGVATEETSPDWTPSGPVRLGVVIPAYDEEARLPRTLARMVEYYSDQDYSWSVTVVSDGSTDRTEEIVREFSRAEPRVQLLALTPNRGKGAAVRTGMLSVNAELLLFCDADLATPQEETAKLLAAIEGGTPIAIGSRPLRDSRLEVRQPLYREMLGRLFNKAVQLLAVPGIDDTQCGFKMFRRDAAREVFSRCKIDGFGFDFEALMVAHDLGLPIAEVGVRWSHQEGSKVSMLRDGSRMLKELVG